MSIMEPVFQARGSAEQVVEKLFGEGRCLEELNRPGLAEGEATARESRWPRSPGQEWVQEQQPCLLQGR